MLFDPYALTSYCSRKARIENISAPGRGDIDRDIPWNITTLPSDLPGIEGTAATAVQYLGPSPTAATSASSGTPSPTFAELA